MDKKVCIILYNSVLNNTLKKEKILNICTRMWELLAVDPKRPRTMLVPAFLGYLISSRKRLMG